jgi:hypothetical protein
MAALLLASATLVQASTIYTISIDLSVYHPGSTLSGSTTVANPLLPGDSVDIALSFSDPGDYSPTSLLTTLSGSGPGSIGTAMRFSGLTFTNVANNATILLAVNAPAQCATSLANPNGVPCSATGQWRDHDPARFTGTYTITATPAAEVPEPGNLSIVGLAALAAFKWLRRA